MAQRLKGNFMAYEQLVTGTEIADVNERQSFMQNCFHFRPLPL